MGNVSIATAVVSYLSPVVASHCADACHLRFGHTRLALDSDLLRQLVRDQGLRLGAKRVTTVLKMLPLLAVGVLGLLAIRTHHSSPVLQVPLSLSGVTAAVTLTLWGVLGF